MMGGLKEWWDLDQYLLGEIRLRWDPPPFPSCHLVAYMSLSWPEGEGKKREFAFHRTTSPPFPPSPLRGRLEIIYIQNVNTFLYQHIPHMIP